MKLIKELIHVPEQISKGDFVLNLKAGIQEPEKTVDNYVVTEQLAAAFDEAMKFIKPVYTGDGGKSKATYLHGSFGCGKSHFMAVLSLILQGHSAVKNKPVLQPVVDKHTWISGKKFLLVPIHMIGVESMEQGILGGYADYIKQMHPTAATPSFYPSQSILENAIELKQSMGDDAFFAKLNSGGESADGWGEMSATWNNDSFNAAVNTKDPMAEEHRQLVSDVIQHFLSSVKNHGDYVSLDDGLVALSHHAKDLGYEGIILFLDELVLWLMSRSVDKTFIGREGPKMSKLVEGRIADAPIPIVSFIARQRDLRDVLGDQQMAGSGIVALTDTMDWWDERFHTIKLEDRNLPVIVRERLLKPIDDSAKLEIDQAFRETANVRKEVRDVLTTSASTVDDFQNLYPFSPALIQVLVAVSAVLQRERTALRILLQMLCDKREELSLGQVVPVGDLWDEITGGDEAFAPQMKERVNQARLIYDERFLPMLLGSVNMGSEEALQTASAEVKTQFQNQDRIVKTLLLAALVPGVESLKNLTAKKLAALNHGTIKSPIRGREGATVLTWVKKWNAQVGEIRQQGDNADPFISIELSGIDTDAILKQAQAEDNPGQRKRLILSLLSEALDFPLKDDGHEFTKTIIWRGTQRDVDIRYFNLREANSEQLRSSADQWTLVLDFPFDDSGYTPADDVSKFIELKAKFSEGTNTLVWLPNFLSDQALHELGKLVIINYLLTGNRLDAYTEHLNAGDKIESRNSLVNQQSALKQRMLNYLEMCYGLTSAQAGAVDEHFINFSDHFRSLSKGFQPQPPQHQDLQSAMENLVHQALEHQYPLHPNFGMEVKATGLKRIANYITQALNNPHSRCENVERAHVDFIKKIAEPLELGSSNENIFTLKTFWKDHFRKELGGTKDPTVQDLYDLIDKPECRGLSDQLKNLVVWQYAHQNHDSFFKYGSKVQVDFTQLQPAINLKPEPLPNDQDWEKAIERSEYLFGYKPPLFNFKTVPNVDDLLSDINKWQQDHLHHVQGLVGKLKLVCEHIDLELTLSERLKTAEETSTILTTLNNKSISGEENLIKSLADMKIKSNLKDVASTVNQAEDIVIETNKVNWKNLKTLTGAGGDISVKAQTLCNEVRGAMSCQETALGLKSVLQEFDEGMNSLLIEAQKRLEDNKPDVDDEEKRKEQERQQEELRKREEQAKKREEELERKAREFEELQRKAEEQRRHDAEQRRLEEEKHRQEEEARKRAEEAKAQTGFNETYASDDIESDFMPKLKALAQKTKGKKLRVSIEVLEN